MKNEGGLGKLMQTNILTDYHSFQDLYGKFSHLKAIDFLIFFLSL